MTSSANRYRQKAAEFAALAQSEANPKLRLEYATMSAGYLRLAAMAERNSLTDVVYEPPD